MLLNAAAGSILRTVHVMQSRDIVRSVFSAMVCFCEMILLCYPKCACDVCAVVVQDLRVFFVEGAQPPGSFSCINNLINLK